MSNDTNEAPAAPAAPSDFIRDIVERTAERYRELVVRLTGKPLP